MSLTKEIVGRVIDRMLDIWETADTWTQGAAARDQYGQDVSADAPNAVKWCAVGCKAKAMHDLGLYIYDYNTEFEEFLNYYTGVRFNGVENIVRYNDDHSTTFEDVRLFVKTLKDMEIPPHLVDSSDAECWCDECVTDRQEAEDWS